MKSEANHSPAPIAKARHIFQLLEETAARTPDFTALSLQKTRLSYAELKSRVLTVAASLAALGVKKSDRVVLLLPNTPTYVIAFYALMRLGAVVVNVSPSSQGAELGKILADCQAETIISLDLFLPGLYKVLPSTACKQLFITSVQGLEKQLPLPPNVTAPRLFDELLAPASETPDAPVEAGDLALLQYTSGATGAPKGVMLTHRNILASVEQTSAWMHHEETPNAGVICIIPFFHVFGMTVGLHLSIALGYRMILVPRFDALDLMPLVELITSERPISFPAVPALWAAIVENPHVTAETLSSLRVASSGGAPLPSWVQDKYRALTGQLIYEAYGLSEAAGATHCVPFPQGAPAGSIGLPLSLLQVRLVAPNGEDLEVGTGEVGEIALRGAPITRGYFRNETLSQSALRGGWLRTGDLARRDANGFFYIVDRKDDLILVSGHNVYPSEIESLLAGHPDVKDIAVVGRPDRLRGSIVVAYIVPRDGEKANSDELLKACREALLQRCRENLPDWKVPRRLVFVQTLPKNPAGKTLHRTLRDAPA